MKKYLERFNLMETKLKNSNGSILNILLAQHFLQRSKLGNRSIQNILSKVETENEENVLKDIKKKYEILINSNDDEVKTTTAFYGNKSSGYNGSNYDNRNGNRNGNRNDFGSESSYGKRKRSRSRSSKFRQRGKSRSRSRGRNDRGNRESSHVAYTCEKFNLPDSDFSKNPEELNVFKSETQNKAIVDSACPKTVV